MARRRFQETQQTERIRPKQVSSVLSRVIQERIIRGFADPRIRGLVSVTKVELSADLLTAWIGISVLPDKYATRVLSGLRSADGLFRKLVRDETSLRRVPRLIFRLDTSMKEEAALDAAICEFCGSRDGTPKCAKDEVAAMHQLAEAQTDLATVRDAMEATDEALAQKEQEAAYMVDGEI